MVQQARVAQILESHGDLLHCQQTMEHLQAKLWIRQPLPPIVLRGDALGRRSPCDGSNLVLSD